MKTNIKNPELSIYVHIPFCVQKCLYCDFLSGPASKEKIDRYIEALCKEISWYHSIFRKHTIRSVFLGGGTPSILDAGQIEKLMSTIAEQAELNIKAEMQPEITMEANPGTLTKEKLETCWKSGINRLSIGLQSADNEELKRLGRIHTYEEFLHSYFLARETGFQNINIDLMSGLPGQSMETFLETLLKVLELKPEHISAYSLIVEEGTPFYKIYGEGKGEDMLPDDELDRAMYHKTRALLYENGYEQYEISNYAKPGLESRHNISYWKSIPYLGLGLGASSLYEHKRFHNKSSMEDYLTFVEQTDSVKIMTETEFAMPGAYIEESLTVNAEMDEFMILGLRMIQGVSYTEFKQRFGKTIKEIYPKQLKRFLEEKLLIESEDRLMLTDRGIDVSNQVFMEFLRD